MQRFFVMSAVLCGLGLSAAPTARAQESDEITHYDKSGKEVKTSGTITDEDPGTVSIKRTLNAVKVPSPDIIDIAYGLRPKLKIPYIALLKKEKDALAVDEAKRKGASST